MDAWYLLYGFAIFIIQICDLCTNFCYFWFIYVVSGSLGQPVCQIRKICGIILLGLPGKCTSLSRGDTHWLNVFPGTLLISGSLSRNVARFFYFETIRPMSVLVWICINQDTCWVTEPMYLPKADAFGCQHIYQMHIFLNQNTWLPRNTARICDVVIIRPMNASVKERNTDLYTCSWCRDAPGRYGYLSVSIKRIQEV